MKLHTLFELKHAPAYQNKMFDTREAALACPTGDVVLAQDKTSGIVTNIAYDPNLLRYDETYQNEQGLSSRFREHLDLVLEHVAGVFVDGDILEIGCGKGLFVELMRNRGLHARGIDDAYEGQSPYIEKRHFGTATEAPADAIVLRHVLEHIPDPLHFLQMIADANGGRGLIYIEVPCFEWIMSHHAWFDVFYEHVNYFRLSDFHRIFARIVDAGHLFQGQYLYVIADLSSLCGGAPPADPAVIDFPADFTQAVDALADHALETQTRQRSMWGAAAKGVMFAYHLGLRGAALGTAIDINPGKQGRFLASTALQVETPQTALSKLPPGSDIYVMNSNYLGEISAMGGDKFHYIPADKS